MAQNPKRRGEDGEIRLPHGKRIDPQLERAHERTREKLAAARRTKLHSFGLAGGRR